MKYFVRYSVEIHDIDVTWTVAEIHIAEDWQIEADEAGVLNSGEYIVSDIGEVYAFADEVWNHTVIMVDPDDLPF